MQDERKTKAQLIAELRNLKASQKSDTNQLYKQYFDRHPDHLAMLDGKGRILDVNGAWTAFAESIGVDAEVVGVGASYFEVCAEATGSASETAQQAVDGIRAVINGQTETFELVYPCHSPDEPRWYRLRATALSDPEGACAVLAHTNITQRYLAAEGQAIGQAVIEALPDLMFRLSREGVHLGYHSPGNGSHLLISPKEFLGRSVGDVLPEDVANRMQEAIARCLESQQLVEFDYDLEFEEGERLRSYDARMVPAGPEEVILIARNTTKRLQDERERSRQLQELVDVSNRLSLQSTVDDLCREAVERGRDVLHFERLGIWLVDQEVAGLRGTFGTDPDGRTVDEREELNEPSPRVADLLAQGGPSSRRWETKAGAEERYVDAAVAALWDGNQIVGVIGMDQLLSGSAITEETQSKLELYASVIGHLLALKRSEEAVRQSEQRFRRIFDESPIGCCEVEVDGGFRRANRSFCDMVGYSPEELTSLATHDITVGTDAFPQSVSPARTAEGKPVSFGADKRYRRKDGGVVWGRLYASVVEGAAGEAAYYISMVEDISERRAQQEALSLSEEMFRGIFDVSAVGITIIRPDGSYVDANPRFCNTLGYDDLKDVKREIIVHPSERDASNAALQKAFETGQTSDWSERRFLHRDGSTVWGRVSGKRIRAADGGYVIIGFMEDITEERRVRKQVELQAHLLDSVREAAVATDLDGRIVFWGKGAERLYGYSAEETLGCSVEEVKTVETPDVLSESWASHHQEKRKDGSLVWVETRVSVISDENGDPAGLVSLDYDVTQRIKDQNELQSARVLLAEGERIARVGSWEWDPDTNNVDWSDGVYRIMGMQPRSIVPHVDIWLRMIHPDDIGTMESLLKRAMHRQVRVEAEYRIVRPDGSIRRLRVVGRVGEHADRNRISVAGIVQDITEAAEARARIVQSEAEKTALLAALPDPVTVLSDDGVIGQILTPGHPELPAPVDDLKGKRLDRILSESVASDFRTSARMATQTGLPQRIQYDHKSRVYETSMAAWGRDEVIAITRNVTERVEAERRLEESEARFRSVFNNAGLGMAVVDVDNRVLDINPAMCTFLGYDQQELIGESVASFTYPEDLAATEESFRRLSSGVSVEGLEKRYLRKDGTAVWGQVWAARVQLSDQMYDVRVVHDLTLEKEAQKALGRAADELASVINTMGDGLAILDENNRVVRVNPRMCDMIGGSEESIVGDGYESWIHPDDLPMVAGKLAQRRSGESASYEFRLLRRDGSSVPVLVAGAPRFHDDGSFAGSVANLKDVTQQKQTEKDMIRLERLRAVGQLAAGVSHNLNNILTTVMGPAEIIQRETDDPIIRREADDIVVSASRAADLVRKLNRSVRAEQENPLGPVELNRVVEEAVVAARPRWKDEPEAAGIAIAVDLNLGDVGVVRGSENAMHDVMLNLLFNAVDSMPEGGSIRIETATRGDGVEVCVTDSGIGMDEDTRMRVFEPFFTTKVAVGTGLGLSTVYNTISGWGGSISVVSAPGQGTTFCISLPAWKGVTESQTQEGPGEVAHVTGGTILVVDDDPMIGRLLANLLQVYHEVHVENEGAAAVAWLRNNACDAAILDLGLPDIPGDRLTGMLKEIRPELVTILDTGWMVEPGDPRLEGFDFALEKPFRLERVLEVVGEAVALAWSRGE